MSAEYYDQLNLQTAYFPTSEIRGEIGDLGAMEDDYDEGEGEEEEGNSPEVIPEEGAMEEDGGEEHEDDEME